MALGLSLRARMVLLVMASIVPLLAGAVYHMVQDADDARRDAESRLTSLASLAAANQETSARSAYQLLVGINSVPGFDLKDKSLCERYLGQLNKAFPQYSNLGVANLDGSLRCDARGSPAGIQIADRAYFKAALARRSFSIGEYTLGRLSRKPVLTFGLPLTDAGDKITGVLFAAVDLSLLDGLADNMALQPGVQLLITDRSGTVLLVRPPAGEGQGEKVGERVGERVASPVLREAAQQMASGLLQGADASGRQALYAFLPSLRTGESPFFISVSVARDDVVGPIQRKLAIELVLIMLIALGSGWIAWRAGGKSIVVPALKILRATGQIRRGDFDARVDLGDDDPRGELSRIAAGVNLMADSLRQRERDFSNELAHSRQAYSTLALTINSMQEGLIAVDTHGALLLVNETATSLFLVDTYPRVLAAEWPILQGMFVPGTERLFTAEELPLNLALRGESGGPMRMLMRNERMPEGRLLSCTYRAMIGPTGIVGALMLFSDVTDVASMQAEQEKSYIQLRDTQRRLLDAQRIGRIGIWELDLESKRVWWSPEVYDIFGVQPEDFDGTAESVVQMMLPEDRLRYQRQREAAWESGGVLDVEYRITTPAGEVRWIHQVGQRYAVSHGEKNYRGGVVQEITARKNAELVMSRATELLNRTGEMARVGGWEVELDTQQSFWSEEIYRIHELDPTRPFSAMQALTFYAPEAQRDFRRAVREAVERGKPWDMELPMITAQGRHIRVRTQGQALMQDGKITRLAGSLQDITEKHDAQEQLRLLEAAISRLNDMVLITEGSPLDEPGPRIIFVNDAFEKFTGYARAEVLGRSPRFLQGPDTQRAELDRIREALHHQRSVTAELINYKRDGTPFWLEMDIVPLLDRAGERTHFVAVERDITERKRAEQALVDSEQRYAALFDKAPIPMCVFDKQTHRYLTANAAAQATYGYSLQEFQAMDIFGIRPESEHPRLRRDLDEGYDGAKNREGFWVHRRKDGSLFSAAVLTQSIQYQGRPACFVVALDMSTQVKAEKEVQDQLYTLQRAADATQAITWHQTLEGTMQEVAEQARGVIGAHRSLVSLTMGNGWADAIHAASLSEKYAAYRGQVDQTDGSGIYAMVCDNNRAVRMTQDELEAHPRWPRLSGEQNTPAPMRGWLAVPLLGRSGKNIGLLQLSDKYEGEFTKQDEYVAIELAQLAAIAIENAQLLEEVGRLNAGLESKVTERTAALTRQEALFRALADQAPQVVWTANPKGRVTYLNRSWFDLAGGDFDKWSGTQWFDAIHPDDLPVVRASWQTAVAKAEPFAGIRRWLGKDGNYHTMSYRASPVLDGAGQVEFWVGIDADVTEMKAIEAALRLSNQELEAFSYSVSHDLRSPLNTVDGFSRLLGKQLGDNPNEKVQHYLSRIQAGVAQMGRLIEDLLSLAQVARMQLRYERLDVSQAANEIIEDWRNRQPGRDKVSVHVAPGLAAYGDARLVRVVLENLLGNAWKFTSQAPQAEITVGCEHNSVGDAVFFVRDNGAGFDMAYADKLFTAFQRLHAVSEFPGTGIGLATVGRVVARHGGQVWAQSAPGQGATFFFTWPGITPQVH